MPLSESHLAVIFSLASAVLAATFSLIVRRGQVHGNAATGVIIGLIVNIPWLVAATIWLWEPSWWNPWAFLLLTGSGLTGPALGRMFMFLGIHNLGVSRAMPLMATNPLFTAVLAYSILGERPGPYIWAGTFLVVAGCVAITMKGKTEPGWNRRAIWLPLAAVAGFSISNIFRKAGMEAVPSPILGITLTSLTGLIFLLLSMRFMPAGHRPNLKWGKVWTFYGVCGLINSFAFLSHFAAIRYGDLTVISPLSATAPFFALTLSLFFLRDLERVTAWIVSGTVFVVAGGALIAWRIL